LAGLTVLSLFSFFYFHLLTNITGVDGLTGNEYNLVNVSDPKSARVYVDDKGPFVAPCDPDHGTPGTTFKIFGSTYVKEGINIYSA
jgi:hypothetical protein